MLNEEMTHVVLAESYWRKNSWGFPKGKVNEDEAAHRCAGLFFIHFFLHSFLPSVGNTRKIYQLDRVVPSFVVLNRSIKYTGYNIWHSKDWSALLYQTSFLLKHI